MKIKCIRRDYSTENIYRTATAGDILLAAFSGGDSLGARIRTRKIREADSVSLDEDTNEDILCPQNLQLAKQTVHARERLRGEGICKETERRKGKRRR